MSSSVEVRFHESVAAARAADRAELVRELIGAVDYWEGRVRALTNSGDRDGYHVALGGADAARSLLNLLTTQDDRRGYLMIGGGLRTQPVYFTDDRGELEERYPDAGEILALATTPRELRELRRLYG